MTAVEWLIKELNLEGYDYTIEQAKQMENEQLNIARIDGINLANKGYGSKGSDEIKKAEEMGLYDKIELANPNDSIFTSSQTDQAPDVRKMVEDDNYLTPIDWLMDRIKWIHKETYDYLIKEGQYDVAKRTENAILEKANEMVSSQTEISDEEIEKIADEFALKYYTSGVTEDEVSAFVKGMIKYREQLKKKQ